MKIRLILAIAALVALPQLVKAQPDGQRGKDVRFHHELNVSFGLGPNMTNRVFDNLKAPYLDKYHLEYEGECFDVIGESFLTLSLQYHYRLNNRWAVGIMAGWGRATGGYENSSYQETNSLLTEESSDSPAPWGDAKVGIFYVMPSVKLTWKHFSHCQFYSQVAAGMMRRHSKFSVAVYDSGNAEAEPKMLEKTDEIVWRPSYQLTAFGINVGGERLNFFSELGYGCAGVFNMGFRISL